MSSNNLTVGDLRRAGYEIVGSIPDHVLASVQWIYRDGEYIAQILLKESFIEE